MSSVSSSSAGSSLNTTIGHHPIVSIIRKPEDGAIFTIISNREKIKAHTQEVHDKKLKRLRHVFVPDTDEIKIILTDGSSVWKGMILHSEHNLSRLKPGS